MFVSANLGFKVFQKFELNRISKASLSLLLTRLEEWTEVESNDESYYLRSIKAITKHI